jgi:hypothetical protein
MSAPQIPEERLIALIWIEITVPFATDMLSVIFLNAAQIGSLEGMISSAAAWTSCHGLYSYSDMCTYYSSYLEECSRKVTWTIAFEYGRLAFNWS